MSVEPRDAASTPDWGTLSEELQALVTTSGPLSYGQLLMRYQAAHGRRLDFHGHRLRDSLTNGNLKGLLFNPANHTLELDLPPDNSSVLRVDELLARELLALVSTEGPLQTSVATVRYQAMYGKQLTLHGFKLRDRLDDGNLHGLRYNEKRGTVELTLHAAAGSSTDGKRLADGRDRLADELRRLVIKKGPLALIDVSSSYSSLFHKGLSGKNLKANLRQGNLRGVRYDERSGKMVLDDTPSSGAREPEAHAVVAPAAATIAGPAPATVTEGPAVQRQAVLQDADASATTSEQRPRATLQTPVSATQQPVLMSGRASDVVGGVPGPSPSTAPSPSSSSPSGAKLRYFLIDSPASCKKALATLSRSTGAAVRNTLQHVCMGSMVVVQLNGRQLGSEAGFISLIKVVYYCCRFVHTGCCCVISKSLGYHKERPRDTYTLGTK